MTRDIDEKAQPIVPVDKPQAACPLDSNVERTLFGSLKVGIGSGSAGWEPWRHWSEFIDLSLYCQRMAGGAGLRERTD